MASHKASLPVRKARVVQAAMAMHVQAKAVVLAVVSRKVHSRVVHVRRHRSMARVRVRVVRRVPVVRAKARVVQVAKAARRSVVRASLIRCKRRLVLLRLRDAATMAVVLARCVPVVSRVVAWMACRAAAKVDQDTLVAYPVFCAGCATLVVETVVSVAAPVVRHCGAVNKRL